VCLPAFLLGIWHFIITSKIKNTTGKATADLWCKQIGTNQRAPFSSDIGNGVDRKRQYNIYMPTIVEDDDEDATILAEDEPSFDDEEPYVEDPNPEPIPNTTTQFIQTPAIFINHAPNVMQIQNTGTINIDRGGKT
jgi:hypothetical protein